ncbi:MAG: SurA N-terminal domain-containing protein [Desulfobacterales bacterium]|nr:SurA N-terminal domain-containing protein [Desulfobacterales bacterium]
MLDLMRRKAQSPIIQITVVIIALVFVFWGVGSSQRGSSNEIAQVNDQAITVQEYRQALDRMITAYRQQLGDNLPDDLVNSLGIKEQALEQLIQNLLLRQGAREMGLLVSKEEVKQSIEKLEAFRSNGAFDMNQYKKVLAGSRMTPAGFESSVRTDLLSGKLLQALARLTKVTPAEIKERFIHENEEINLEYVRFQPADFTARIKLSDQDLESYYQENKENYKTEPQVRLQYLAYSLKDFLDTARPSDKEIRAYYRNNRERFSTPELRTARHILLKLDNNAPEEQVRRRQQEAEEILARARAGADFAELARKYSEGPSGPKGGYIGQVGRGDTVPAFDTALFALAEGGVSRPVRTSFGLHIIKLESIVPARVISLDEARPEIIAGLKQTRARNLALAAANQAYEKIIMAGSLAKYGATGEATVERTGFFARGAPPAGPVPRDPAFIRAAFGLKKGELSSLVTLDQGYAIIFAEDRKAPEIQPLGQVREQVRVAATTARAESLARKAAEELLRAGKNGDDWPAAVKAAGGSLEQTGFFSRANNAAFRKAMLPGAIIEQGFALTEDRPFPEKIVEQGSTLYVFRLQAKKAPAEELFAEQRAGIKARLEKEKRLALMTAWLNRLRSRAEIEVKREYL